MKKLLFLLLFAPLTVGAELSKTYPTSAITTVRMSAYEDGIFTLAKSTFTVQVSTWNVINTTWTWVNPDQYVYGYSAKAGVVESSFTWIIYQSSWTINEFMDNLVQEERLLGINKILDHDIEQYLVFPSTGACPPGWLGWRQGLVNGKLIPVSCQ